MKSLRILVGASVVTLLLSSARLGRAEAPWVDRAITLRKHDWAFNFGLGIARVPGSLAPGLNVEGAYAVTHGLELGLRTGIRFGDWARAARADVYGRPFDTETYGTGGDVVANPEFHIRGRLVEGEVVELGLEGRVMSPFSGGLGLMFAMPLAFHFGRAARLDTGVYVPVFFYDPFGARDAFGPLPFDGNRTQSFVSIPFHLWFQATNRFWLGPMAGIRTRTSNGSETDVPLGFGLGYSVTRELDFKAQVLFQDVAHGPIEAWGFGGGIEVRIE